MASLGEYIMMAGTVGLALVLLAVIVSVGADILTNIQSGQTANTYAYNATTGGLNALDKVSDNQGTLAIVGIAAVIIGVLFAAFGGFGLGEKQ